MGMGTEYGNKVCIWNMNVVSYGVYGMGMCRRYRVLGKGGGYGIWV